MLHFLSTLVDGSTLKILTVGAKATNMLKEPTSKTSIVEFLIGSARYESASADACTVAKAAYLPAIAAVDHLKSLVTQVGATVADIEELFQRDILCVLGQMELKTISQQYQVPPFSLLEAVLDCGRLKKPQRDALICEPTNNNDNPPTLRLLMHSYFVVKCAHCNFLQNKTLHRSLHNLPTKEPLFLQFVNDENCKDLQIKIVDQIVKLYFNLDHHSKEEIDTFFLECIHVLRCHGIQICGAGTVVQSQKYFQWLADKASLLHKSNVLVHHENNTLWPISLPYFVVAGSITKLHGAFERNIVPPQLLADIYAKKDDHLRAGSDENAPYDNKEIRKQINSYKNKKKRLQKCNLLQPAIEKMVQGEQIYIYRCAMV